MCQTCAGNGYVPDPFGDQHMQAVPCPACSPPAHRADCRPDGSPFPYIARVGAEYVEGCDTLAELVDRIRQVFEPDCGEDVAIWLDGCELVAVWKADGRVVWLDRARVVA